MTFEFDYGLGDDYHPGPFDIACESLSMAVILEEPLHVHLLHLAEAATSAHLAAMKCELHEHAELVRKWRQLEVKANEMMLALLSEWAAAKTPS